MKPAPKLGPRRIRAWQRPIYTVRGIRKEPGLTEVDFDVFLHDGGRTTEWCKSEKLGSKIVLAGPSGSGPGAAAGWNGLIG